MSCVWTGDGVSVNGQELALFSGEIHYWHHEAETWPVLLQQIKELGLRGIRTHVPWGEHEIEKGRYSFANDLDLGGFLDEVHALGLFAIVSLGPSTDLPLPLGGFPERIVLDRSMATKTGRSTLLHCVAPPKMFPLPSYASEAFASEVKEWFSAVGAIVGPRMQGQGAVLSTVVQAGQGAWRWGAFESDYHPDALAWWREEAGDMPVERTGGMECTPQNLRWVQFKERYVAKSYEWLREAALNAGMGPCGGAFPASNVMSQNVYAAMRSKGGGTLEVDFGEVLSTYRETRERALYLSSNSVLPYARLPMGGAFYMPVRSEKEELNIALGALAGGIRAFHISMLTEPANWQGAGIVGQNSRGECRASWLPVLLSALDEVSFSSLRRQVSEIVVVVSRAETRAAIASAALELVPPRVSEQLQLGPSGHAELSMDTSARLYPRWLRALQEALELAELPYRLLDEECLHKIDNSTKTIFVPTLKRVDGALWAGLHALAGSGIRIILGPEQPVEDELGVALGSDGVLPKGAGLLLEESLEDIEGLAGDMLGLVTDPGELWISPNCPETDCSVFIDREGIVRALFMGNREQVAVAAEINVPLGVVLKNAISGETQKEEEGIARVSLQGKEVSFFVVSHAEKRHGENR